VRRLGEPSVVDDTPVLEEKTYEVKDCPWYIQLAENGKWTQRPHVFTTGAALSFQASVGLGVYYFYNYYFGGMDTLRQCWDIKQLIRFAPIGILFGQCAIFGFKAQNALSPGSYALYAQAGIVVIPIMWRIVFKKQISPVTWIHILLISAGIIMYRLSELDEKESFGGVGLFWIVLKVLGSALATCWAESFLKSSGNDHPLNVQMCFILPWKVLSTFSTIWIIPPHGLPNRPGGFFHDWTFWALVIVGHNLGDTIMSATIAKSFDSVVKAVCGVVGIIFPTWIVSWSVGWDKVDVHSAAGQLKISGGIIVIISAVAYTLGRAEWDEIVSLREAVKVSTSPTSFELSSSSRTRAV